MTEAFSKNFIDYEEYPQSADIQNRCVNMIARLFNAPTTEDTDHAIGTSTCSITPYFIFPLFHRETWTVSSPPVHP